MPQQLPFGLAHLAQETVVWFSRHQRKLPWREPDTTPWGILVSEVMLQQTPVARVEPHWHNWMVRWPKPADLAVDTLDEALRLWARLGYPRRARWLHSAARIISERHQGQVPAGREALRALPGIGEYTAAAVQAFAFGLPAVVLDTNVRRVLARFLDGNSMPTTHITNAERAKAQAICDVCMTLQPPIDPATWSAAVMELGALVCTARHPRCSSCPVAAGCAWLQAGSPADASAGLGRKQAPYSGSHREVRGRILAALRQEPSDDHGASDDTTPGISVDHCWPDELQRNRAIESLLIDGLIEYENGYRLARD